MFTGSTEVAALINRSLAARGGKVPLIAETGGQNAMIVDSTALPEQVVGDVVASAFDSAGQRCSALRVLCLQQDIADGVLHMLQGALAELRLGNWPTCAWTSARSSIPRRAGLRPTSPRWPRAPASPACRCRRGAHGTFVAPTLIEIGALSELTASSSAPSCTCCATARPS